MSLSIPISALVLYPFLYLLPLNLVRFRWGLEAGLAPMPPEVREKAEAAERVVLCATHIILLTVVVLLMRSSPISVYEVGLTTENWKAAVGMGVLFSLFPLGLNELALRNVPPEKVLDQSESRGPAAVWYGLITIGSFTNEFWRAFCIVTLMRLGLSPWLAVPIVAIAYGALHIQTSVAKTLGSVAFGGATGFLFINTGSLLSPLTLGLMVAGANLYQVRRMATNRGIHRPESRPSKPCPVCGAIIHLSEADRAADILACPNCGESLTTEKKNLWVIGALSIVAAVYVTRHLVYREPVYAMVTEALALVLFMLGAFLLGLFVPPKYKRVGGKTFDRTMSLFGTDKPDADEKSSRK
jgi:predicted RNA-binding Zn-ribbon protein involved in translation (DUF1610 family)